MKSILSIIALFSSLSLFADCEKYLREEKYKPSAKSDKKASEAIIKEYAQQFQKEVNFQSVKTFDFEKQNATQFLSGTKRVTIIYSGHEMNSVIENGKVVLCKEAKK